MAIFRNTIGERPLSSIDPEVRNLALKGLRKPQKTLPTQLFYDEAGSAIFDEITRLEEYYPTRTEESILRANAGELARAVGPNAMVIEYGSGSSIKTRILLSALDSPTAYVPVDISAEHLEAAAATLRSLYPHLEVLPVAADFMADFEIPAASASVNAKVCFFPGSTIGNFTPDKAVRLLRGMRDRVGEGGLVILGTDMVKDVGTLERAYDDRLGVTARFNLNLLRHVNRVAGADFDLGLFRHRAVYDVEAARIEMHLVSAKPQTVSVGDQRFEFAEGEHIRTEYSHKYTEESVRELAQQAGLRVDGALQDHRGWFTEWILRGV